jgi:hypothetical protein
VRDLHAARGLYASVLRLEVAGRDVFRAGDARIALVQAAEDGPAAITLDASASRNLDPAIAGARIRLEA